jgi:thioesterase domain-containing protein
MADVNKCFGISLPLATIFHAPTVEGIAHAVQNVEALKAKPPGLIAPRIREAPRAVFWAPSVGSVERFVECHNLARLLRGQYDFYGFDPAPEFTDIGSLADHCIRVIRAEQPHGPYSLAGYCQCGHVAYEIAQRLESQGERVDLLAIIDCSARQLAPTFWQRLYWLRDGFRGEPRSVARRLNSALRRRILRTNDGPPAINANGEGPYFAHGLAAARHKTKRFRGKLTLFRSEESSTKFKHTPTLGWNALARKVQVQSVPFPHTAMLSDPAAAQFIAEAFQNHLSAQSQS